MTKVRCLNDMIVKANRRDGGETLSKDCEYELLRLEVVNNKSFAYIRKCEFITLKLPYNFFRHNFELKSEI